MKQSETATSRWYWGLLAIALATHGPLDITITALFWHHESNALVLALGVGPWIAVKAGALVVLGAVAWHWARRPADRPPGVLGFFGVLAALGVFIVATNLWVVLA